MLATAAESVEIGASQSSTSFADIIINNDNAVADGLITGFAQFVHDPKYLKDTVNIFNRQKIPTKFADAVVLRRIETQQLDNIWDFPLNLSCPTTVPLPWTIVDATVKSKTGTVSYEYNIMRIIDFIGRNYVRLALPEVNTTTIQDQYIRSNPEQKMSMKSHMYLGAWHRDLIPRIIKLVSFYPRSNAHKLFEYSGYDIFVHNILFGNAAKRMNDLMAGEDQFELCYDPFAVHGSALGIASYKGVDNLREWDTKYAPDSYQSVIQINGQNTTTNTLENNQDFFVDTFIPDTFMDGEQFANIYRRGVWFEAPVAKNYACRHSIHSRRFIHAPKIITFPLDILPFGYSIASSLPSAALAGDCGYIKIELHDNWFNRAFYLTKVSDVPLLHPIVNHTHYSQGDIVAIPNATKQVSSLVAGTQVSTTGMTIDSNGANAWMQNWVNPLSIGRYGNANFWNVLSGLGSGRATNNSETTSIDASLLDHDKVLSSSNDIVNGYPANQMEGIVYSMNSPAVNGANPLTAMQTMGQVGSGTGNSGVAFGTVNSNIASKLALTGNTSTSIVGVKDAADYLGLSSINIYAPQSIDQDWTTQQSIISVKLLQIGYQTIPAIREFLTKLPNIYLTTEWETTEQGINTTQFDINNDLYIQALIFWFVPTDLEYGIDSMRLYPHHLINHEAPVVPGVKLVNEQSQGTTIFTWDIMNEMTPHLLGCANPLLENMGMIAFTSKLASNSFPYAYYDSNISGYLKCTLLPGDSTNNVVNSGTVVNLRSGKLRVISIGTNGVASVNLNLFRLIF